MDEKYIARFRHLIDQNEPDECWPWVGCVNPRGYGVVWCGDKTRLAHRVAWFLEHGAWPTDCVCHRCDNPPCCNPTHLFAGSRAENLADMRAKGRAAPMPRLLGEKNPTTPLTATDVLAIRAASAAGEPYAWIAQRYQVSGNAVRNICLRKTWKHVG